MTDVVKQHTIESDGADYVCRVTLNADSRIYAAHFPGAPVTPGACTVDVCHSLMAEIQRRHNGRRALPLLAVSKTKFLRPIVPAMETVTVRFADIATSGHRMTTNVAISHDDRCLARLTLTFGCATDTCVIIPTYNNAATVADVARRALAIVPQVIVVDDGSTDGTHDVLASLCSPTADGTPQTDITVVAYHPNRGKGHALLEGFERARQLGYKRAITIDADGQHFPEDITALLDAMDANPDALIVGSRQFTDKNMPGGNTFANRFSNFWFALQTWQPLPDTQTGLRLYPLHQMPRRLWFITSRYEAELELLVAAAWAGVSLVPVPVHVYYPPRGERITHFRPFWDFARISVLNTVLCLLMLVYGWPRIIWRRLKTLFSK